VSLPLDGATAALILMKIRPPPAWVGIFEEIHRARPSKNG